VPGIDDHEVAGGQPLVEKLGVGERDNTVAAAVDDRDRHPTITRETELLPDRGFPVGTACQQNQPPFAP